MKKKHLIDLGKRLKKARMSLGLQQKEMAEGIGVKPPYISSLETGKRSNPSIALLFYLSRHYHISLDYLLHGTGEMFLPSEASDEEMDRYHYPDFNSIDFVVWLMRNSTFAKNNILGFVERFYIENEDFIKNKMIRSKERGQEDKTGKGEEEISVKKPGDEGNKKEGAK
jgi:transcriptional regulator with XRE-family HTH domain